MEIIGKHMPKKILVSLQAAACIGLEQILTLQPVKISRVSLKAFDFDYLFYRIVSNETS